MSWIPGIVDFLNRYRVYLTRRRPRHVSPLVEARRVAREIEINNPELIVAGVRKVSPLGRRSHWVIDILNRETAAMVSLDEHDHWSQRLQELLPQRSLEDARLARPPLPVAPSRGGHRLS